MSEVQGTPSPALCRAAYAAWLRAAGPWRLWCACIPLAACCGAAPPSHAHAHAHALLPLPNPLTIDGIEPSPPEHDEHAADQTVEALLPDLTMGGCALLLEMPPLVGVAVAGRLARAGLARPLLVLGRWPYPRAVLPTHALLEALVREAPVADPRTSRQVASSARRSVPAAVLPNLAVVLDPECSHSLPNRAQGDVRADNRYAIVPADLPDPAALRKGGITRVLHVRASGHPPMSAAVAWLALLAGAGLPVESRETRMDADAGLTKPQSLVHV